MKKSTDVPCHFCEDRASLIEYRNEFYIECDDCSASTRHYDTPSAAFDEWETFHKVETNED